MSRDDTLVVSVVFSFLRNSSIRTQYFFVFELFRFSFFQKRQGFFENFFEENEETKKLQNGKNYRVFWRILTIYL